MSNSKEIALICDESQETISQCTTEDTKKKTSKQTTLDTFFYQFPLDSTSTYLDQPATLQYLDIETTSPVPSVVTALKTPNRAKRAHRRKSKKKQRREEEEVPSSTRRVPLPLLTWAESNEIWRNMIAKEEASIHERNPKLFENQAGYLPRMRAILLDWLMEVCEVYKLRRVTYHLTVDYIDRYLTINPKVPKTQLQLVGVTCLFMAAKLEEIYPPKLSEFSYVCDGACTDAEIMTFELIILNSLGWAMNPQTASGWLNLYLQIHEDAKKVTDQGLHQDINCDFIYPKYSAYEFIRASQIIDLFSLDPGFLRYPYSVIAAAALYFTHGKKVALTVSGLNWEHLKECVEYMAVFYKVIRDSFDPKLQSVISFDEPGNCLPNCGTLKANLPKILTTENHSIQTHSVDLNYFEKATLIRLERMGMRVEKTLVKKKRSDDANETTEEEDTKIMFELEKVNMEEIICLSSPITATVVEEEGEDNATDEKSPIDIFKLDEKARVTFDDILISLQAKETEKPAAVPSDDELTND